MFRTLQSMEQIAQCRDQLKARNLDFTNPARTRFWQLLYFLRYVSRPELPDFRKSWDVQNAADIITARISDKSSPILDMGCFSSEILFVLLHLGYANIHGCDLRAKTRWMPYWNKIHYQVADLTATPYPDHYFAAITALSTIEHGVPLPKLAAEAKRLLKPGGIFILTTDYDATGKPHDIPADFRKFDATWKIFARDELWAAINIFQSAGFTLLDPANIQDTHQQTPIHWNNQDYTFALVALAAPENKA